MSFDEAAMLEPLAVTVHAVKRFSPVKGAKAAVLGCGPIGILLIQSLKALGAAEVFATDVSDYRLKLAAELGADYTVNTKEKDFSEEFLKAFGPDKADVIFECAGCIMIESAFPGKKRTKLIYPHTRTLNDLSPGDDLTIR